MAAAGRILIVDDDDTIRELITLALCDENYEAMAARHGGEALLVIETFRPDLILLDMRMPIMDGWEFAAAYQQLPGPHAPIVVLTAGRAVEDTVCDIQADGFLAKPFNLDDLLTVVAQLLQR